MFSELRVLVGQERKPPEQEARDQHHRERGKDASDTPRIEVSQAETIVPQAAENDAGDEVAGDDKKHVHADKAAADQAWKGVEAQDRQNGYCAKAVDVRTVRDARFRRQGCR